MGGELGKWFGMLLSKPWWLLPQFVLIECVKIIGDVGGYREFDVVNRRGRRGRVTVTDIELRLRCRPRNWLLCGDIRFLALPWSTEKNSWDRVRDSLGGDAAIHANATAIAHTTHSV